MKAGDLVLFVGCGHEEPCLELARPCSVDLYGRLEIAALVQRRGRPLVECELADGSRELFDPFEVDTIERVTEIATRNARAAARAGGGA